jgi:hypothetical protein
VIPGFNEDGQLPEGIYRASWTEFCDRFGLTEHRKSLLKGLHELLRHLASVGCKAVYIDGSFVTDKKHPNDYDACWDAAGVRIERLDRVLLDFSDDGKAVMQSKYRGDIRMAECFPVERDVSYLEFFQTDRLGRRKGIVRLVPSEIGDDKE